MAIKKTRLLKTLILVIVIFASAYGVLFSLRFALGTEYPVVVVRGKSMVPTFYDGDLLIVKGISEKDTIEPQDIIVFHSPYDWSTLIVHRVLDKKIIDGKLYFTTKGDNNAASDPWKVAEDDVAGVVLQKIPYMGGLVNVIQSRYGVGVLYGLIVIVILVELFYKKE